MQSRQGFKVGGEEDDLFKGTAAYYAKYRRTYPKPVIDYLIQRYGLDGTGRLLDAGCGTGQVFCGLASHFEDVLAIDPDPEMVVYAQRAANERNLSNVRVRRMRAEDVGTQDGPFRLAVFGASFHWTDRKQVANKLYDLILPVGALAVLSPGGIHSGQTPWEIEIREVLERHFGTTRRAGGGVYQQGERHEEALARTLFGQIEVVDIPVLERWSMDEIIGYLYSTSYASKIVLGERTESFEMDIRNRLSALSADGSFEKLIEYTVISAAR